MKLNSIRSLGKAGLLTALVLGFAGSTLNAPSYAWNWGGWGTPPQSGSTFAQRHPRRAEVLKRDNRLNYDINKDAGKLHGSYGELKAEDKVIRRQEQADAKANGGYITKQQQAQLNQEESQLHQQINQDLRN